MAAAGPGAPRAPPPWAGRAAICACAKGRLPQSNRATVDEIEQKVVKLGIELKQSWNLWNSDFQILILFTEQDTKIGITNRKHSSCSPKAGVLPEEVWILPSYIGIAHKQDGKGCDFKPIQNT